MFTLDALLSRGGVGELFSSKILALSPWEGTGTLLNLSFSCKQDAGHTAGIPSIFAEGMNYKRQGHVACAPSRGDRVLGKWAAQCLPCEQMDGPVGGAAGLTASSGTKASPACNPPAFPDATRAPALVPTAPTSRPIL